MLRVKRLGIPDAVIEHGEQLELHDECGFGPKGIESSVRMMLEPVSRLSDMHSLFVHDHGTGPPLVLIHGFCETSEIWNSFIKPLTNHYRVIRPDLPDLVIQHPSPVV